MSSLGSVSSGGGLCGGGIQRAGCGFVGGLYVGVISSLLGTLGLAAPSPASVQNVERDTGLGKENREKS